LSGYDYSTFCPYFGGPGGNLGDKITDFGGMIRRDFRPKIDPANYGSYSNLPSPIPSPYDVDGTHDLIWDFPGGVSAAPDYAFYRTTSQVSGQEFDIRWLGEDTTGVQGNVAFRLNHAITCPNGATKFIVARVNPSANSFKYGAFYSFMGRGYLSGANPSLMPDGLTYQNQTYGQHNNPSTNYELVSEAWGPDQAASHQFLPDFSDATGSAFDVSTKESWGRNVGGNGKFNTGNVQIMMYRMNNSATRYANNDVIKGQIFQNGVHKYNSDDIGSGSSMSTPDIQSYQGMMGPSGNAYPHANLGAYGHMASPGINPYYRDEILRGGGMGFAEMLIFDTALSASDIDTVMSYLGNKYGVTADIQLPINTNDLNG
jgi:hypothetical protein